MVVNKGRYMAAPVVVDAGSTPLHSPTKLSPRMRTPASRRTLKDDFGTYELGALAVTQLSFIPVTSTMLTTSFYEPSKELCSLLATNSSLSLYEDVLAETNSTEFVSLPFTWDRWCDSSIMPFFSTTIMLGALLGAFLAGWLADAYGRRPVLKGSLLIVGLGNLAMSLVGPSSMFLSAGIMLVAGMACGGYMVTNLVLLVECLELPRSRLLAVSLNGWSVSMVAVALLGRLTLHWLSYHLITAGLALIAAAACHTFLVESCRWLAGVHRMAEARTSALTIAARNKLPVYSDSTWWELLGFSQPTATPAPARKEFVRTYGYRDLFTVPSVYWPLIALSYCFVASSIVSFGSYFTVDKLPSDRYTNLAVMGITKFAMGCIPFAVSTFLGRRPIVLTSVGIACLAAWGLCVSQWVGVSPEHWSMSALLLAIAASLDPTWKINHLYSTELFPTVVRNMARGVCNVGARLGSVVAPSLVFLRSVHYMIPFIIFAVLLSIQWVIVAAFLPETKDRQLDDEFPQLSTNSELKEVAIIALEDLDEV